MNNRGVIDGGVIIALVGLVFGAIVVSRETVSRADVVNAEPIQVDSSIYTCEKVFELEYYPVRTRPNQPAKIIKKPAKRDCK